MITLISPSKGQDFSPNTSGSTPTSPFFLNHSEELIKELRKLNHEELSKLMGLSDKLTELNLERYQRFETPFTTDNAKEALLAFTGDVYSTINTEEYSSADFDFAQKHLRILSGLYGLLRPLDLIQAYRLEMKIKLNNAKGSNLYQFWDDLLVQRIKDELAEQNSNTIVNLASNEYFKALKKSGLKGVNLITPNFKEERDGSFKVIALFAKKARGMMADYIIKHKIDEVEEIKHFSVGGYLYNQNLSSETEWVFTR